jgi:hypothetical protein
MASQVVAELAPHGVLRRGTSRFPRIPPGNGAKPD